MNIKKTFTQVGKTINKHSPAIFTTAGIAGYGYTAYLAYKSRDKVEAITVNVEEARNNEEEVNRTEVFKDLVNVLYLPITTGVLSTASIIMAHRIQRKRIMALTGALAAQQAQNLYFETKYKEKYGEEEFEKFATPTEQIKTETKDKNGKKKEKIEEIKKDTDATIGEWFDKSTEYVNDDHSYNMAYIRSIEEKMQARLFQRGSLLLNEVREALGFDRVRAGALLGWTTAENFDIHKAVTNLGDTENGELKEQIYVSWTTPKYIYDEVEFNSRYSIY